MSKPQVIYWPPSNTDGIAAVQSVEEDDNIILKSNTPSGSFLYNNIIRSIIIDYNAAVPEDIEFIIKGKGISVDINGNPTSVVHDITITIDGNVGGNVESKEIFTEIYSITVTEGDVSNLSIGYGTFGITQYILNDTNRTGGQLQVQVQVINRVNLTAYFDLSLNKPESPDSNGNLIPFGIENGVQVGFIYILTIAAITSNVAIALPCVTNCWLKITDTTTDSLYFTVLQQGTNSR